MKLNKPKDAINILEQNLKTSDTLYDKTQWYLALAYIKANANHKAKSTLKGLIANGNYKKKEAEQLLKQLPL